MEVGASHAVLGQGAHKDAVWNSATCMRKGAGGGTPCSLLRPAKPPATVPERLVCLVLAILRLIVLSSAPPEP